MKTNIYSVQKYLLYFILFFGLSLRMFNVNWDNSSYFQPDERAIILITTSLTFPHSVYNFFSAQSSLNPHFFAYGNFPLYLLKIVSFLFSYINPLFLSYGKIHLVARPISAVFDTCTILLVYLLSKKIFTKEVGLLSAFIYSVSVLPIQLSHFFAVDTILTFFIMLTLLFLLSFYEHPNFNNAVKVGVSFGFALATKISALPLIISIFFAIYVDFILILIKNAHNPKTYLPHLPLAFKRLITDVFVICFITCITLVYLEPYAFIDFKEFLQQNSLQSQMTHNPFTFPYTFQYVDKIRFFYEIQNIFLWGLGPVIGALSLLGFGYFLKLTYNTRKINSINKEIILLAFFISYFLIVGNFAVGFIRYMLPLYPFFAIFSGLVLNLFLKSLKKMRALKIIVFVILYILILYYPFSFLSIYTKPNTRIQATDWILKNIPAGKTLAVENWDDALPVHNGTMYQQVVLNLFDAESPEKWQSINSSLSKADYIIVASTRVYVPIQKLTNCRTLPPSFCHRESAEYYNRLFNGTLGFVKVAEFKEYPTVPFLNLKINDDHADESFTVFDHPKIMIFKKR